MTSKLSPDYYQGSDGKDLFDRFESGLLSPDEVRGFYKGNIIKYVTRYQGKHGVEDLQKAGVYLSRLEAFETHTHPLNNFLKAIVDVFAKIGRGSSDD